jgi:hypothetical protein
MEEVTTWRRAAGDRKPASVPRIRLARQVSIESDAGMLRRTDAGWQLSQGSEHSDAFITDLSLRSVSLRDTASATTVDIEPPPRGTTRRVLVASGDPRSAGNQFGFEAAEIRRSLLPAKVDVREVACIDLAELPQHLDALCPAAAPLSRRAADDHPRTNCSGDLCGRAEQTVARG